MFALLLSAAMKHQCLFSMIVDESMRGKGIGGYLLDELMRVAKEKFGVEFMHLEVYDGNVLLALINMVVIPRRQA